MLLRVFNCRFPLPQTYPQAGPSTGAAWIVEISQSRLGVEKTVAPRAERNCELCAADPPQNYATAHYHDSEARPRSRRADPACRRSEADIEGTRRPARS